MNKLQGQPFKINHPFLNFLIDNDDFLVKKGLLMPSFLLKININEVADRVRKFFVEGKSLYERHKVSFGSVMQILSTNIQRARYERTIIEMASAFDGYQFDLPAFLDFRGRIYRCGILHFHERDLARSLILIDDDGRKYLSVNPYEIRDTYMTTAAFQNKSFRSESDALQWVSSQRDEIDSWENRPYSEWRDSVKECTNTDQLLIHYSMGSKNPFQYLMYLWGYMHNRDSLYYYFQAPIIQDASASAYQIMSYLLLNVPMAKRTNLIVDSANEAEQRIEDVYTQILHEFKAFLNKEMTNSSLKTTYNMYIDRKIRGFFTRVRNRKGVETSASVP